MSTTDEAATGGALDWPGTLVGTEWLATHLGHPALRIIDMRGYVKTTMIGEGKQQAQYTGAREEYEAGHIPGAVYVDWTKDIVDPDDPVPAQLARPEQFAALMGRLGIGDESYVVPAQLRLADEQQRPIVTMPTSTGTLRRYQRVILHPTG